MEVMTADDSQHAAVMQSSDPNARHLLQSTMSPEDACALFGHGFVGTYWDAEKSQPREYPEGCGLDGVGTLSQAGSKDAFKKVCSFTGPATSTSCGENGYFGYLNKFASPLMGLITDKCR
jgi:hypothetical protein